LTKQTPANEQTPFTIV